MGLRLSAEKVSSLPGAFEPSEVVKRILYVRRLRTAVTVALVHRGANFLLASFGAMRLAQTSSPAW